MDNIFSALDNVLIYGWAFEYFGNIVVYIILILIVDGSKGWEEEAGKNHLGQDLRAQEQEQKQGSSEVTLAICRYVKGVENTVKNAGKSAGQL